MVRSLLGCRLPMRHRLDVLAAAILFSTAGGVIKLTTLSGWRLAGLRSLVAALFILAALPAARVWPRRGQWPAAVAMAVTVLLFVLANRLTTAASAIFLQATAPVWLLLLAPVFLGESPRPRDVAAGAAMAAGMALMFSAPAPHTALAPDPRTGDVLAATTGLTWALVVLTLRREQRDGAGNAAPVIVAGHLLAFLAAVPFMAGGGAIGARDLALAGALGVVQVGLASVLLLRGVRRVPAIETSLLILLEPALSPLWAWLLAGERPTATALVGGAVILGAALLHAVRAATSPAGVADEHTADR